MDKNDTKYARTMVGVRIHGLRREQNLSLRCLSLIVGLDHAYIYEIEQGQANATLSTLAKIADGLGVELKDLFDF